MNTRLLWKVSAVLCVLSGVGVTIRASGGPTEAPASKPELVFKFIAKPVDGNRRNLMTSKDNLFYLHMRLKGGLVLDKRMLTDVIMASMPKEYFKSDEVQAMLQSGQAIERIYTLGGAAGITLENHCEIGIAAPTKQQVQELARTLIDVCNIWWQKNWREHLQHQTEEHEEHLAKLQAQLQPVEAQCKSDEETLKQLWPIKEQTLVDLTTRQFLLEVEIAGIQARIDAVQRLSTELDKEKTPAEIRDHLESIRITAHVDMAGLLAQQNRLSAILKANSRLGQLKGELQNLKWQKESLESGVALLKKSLASDQPKPFEVVGDVTIWPIDWQDDASSSQPASLRRTQE